MSRKKIILVAALAVICAGVNVPRWLAEDVEELPEVPLESGVEVPDTAPPNPRPAPPEAENDDAVTATEDPGESSSTTESPEASGPTATTEARDPLGLTTPHHFEDLLARLGESLGRGAVPDASGQPRSRSPFAFAPAPEESPVEAPANDVVLELAAARKAAAAAEKARLEAESMLDARRAAREAEIRAIPIHAILNSRAGGTVRIDGYNLKVGRRIPGHDAVIKAIHRDHVDVELDGRVISLFLRGARANTEEPARQRDVAPAPTENAATEAPAETTGSAASGQN